MNDVEVRGIMAKVRSGVPLEQNEVILLVEVLEVLLDVVGAMSISCDGTEINPYSDEDEEN